MRVAVAWGCPFALYWELYNNEVEENGKQRGFWLIDDKGVKQPVYHTHQRFYQRALKFVAESRTKTGRDPSAEEFARFAAALLSHPIPPPVTRD